MRFIFSVLITFLLLQNHSVSSADIVSKVRSGADDYRSRIKVPASLPVIPGLDVLAADNFKVLHGKRVGVISNHTGITLDGTSIVKLFHESPQVNLVAAFAPEHGFTGAAEAGGRVDDAVDSSTGLTIYSLYGKTKRPTPQSLENVDVLVFDIQDIGARFYTYISTMLYCMEEAAKKKIAFVVLDRPNPIRGDKVEGPVSEKAKNSFVSCHPIATRHGMTVGELALLFNIELELNLDLHVVPCLGWKRSMDFEAAGLSWVNPSPNMRSLTAEYLYTGTCLVESSNMSVGRGTDFPFEWVGAPWIHSEKFAAALRNNAKQVGLQGVRFEPYPLTPRESKHNGIACGGVRFVLENPDSLKPVRLGLVLLTTLLKEYPLQWKTEFSVLLANTQLQKMILENASVAEVEAAAKEEFERFLKRREQVLLY
ncbi:MAG: DUF1343 domain-containing protein [Planctomycetaceae bacterium]|nr:DUF1343 domain-containing protein [Planctomycetaceae bacterium]